LIIRNLKLTNYKNYEKESLIFSSTFNLVVGLNGMGKTNLLDAIYYCCVGKSYFNRSDRSVVRKSADFLRLEGKFIKGEDTLDIRVKLLLGKAKEISKNNVVYDRLMDHVGHLTSVMISPRDIQLFYEGSLERRKFIDFTISQYDREYLIALSHYNHIIKQRNALLKSFYHADPNNESLLEVYNLEIIDPANFIHRKRNEFIEKLAPLFTKYYNLISDSKEDGACVYTSQLESSAMKDLLIKSRERDLVMQRTTCGIHKDDLQFVLNDSPLKTFGSQGQLKSFVLALKLAQYELLFNYLEHQPILLLDDIFDKLDEERVRNLLSILKKDIFGQVFITDTKEQKLKSLLKELKIPFDCFTIKNGSVTTDEKA